MLAERNEDLRKVLDEYDIKVLDIKTESYKEKKGVWWIHTSEGYRILKKQSNSKETLEFITSAVEYLTVKGVCIPEIIFTKQGQRIAYVDENCYILSKAIEGVNPSYSKLGELRKIMEELAKFHASSRGFVPPESCKSRIHLGELIESHKDKMEKLEVFYEQEKSKRKHTAFGSAILEQFPHFKNRIDTAIKALNESCYQQWVNEVANLNYLCHQDFAAGNLIMTDSGDLYVLDIDSITIDIPIRDIRKILNKVMKKHGGWDDNLAKDMLGWYQDKNRLDYLKWQVLKAELTYPYLFEGIMSKYYENREKTWTQEKYLKRLNEMLKIERSVEPIIENFDAIVPA